MKWKLAFFLLLAIGIVSALAIASVLGPEQSLESGFFSLRENTSEINGADSEAECTSNEDSQNLETCSVVIE